MSNRDLPKTITDMTLEEILKTGAEVDIWVNDIEHPKEFHEMEDTLHLSSYESITPNKRSRAYMNEDNTMNVHMSLTPQAEMEMEEIDHGKENRTN